MGIKGKLKLIGLLPLIMAVLFGLIFEHGQQQLDRLRERAMLADAMAEELRALAGTARRIFDDRDNMDRDQGYDLLQSLDEQMLALGRWLDDPASSGTIREIGRRLILVRLHFMNLDGLSMPALAQLDVPQIHVVDQRLRHQIDGLTALVRQLHRDTNLASVTSSHQLWMVELGLLAVVAVLVLLLTYPTLHRVATAIHALGLETQQVGQGGAPHDLVLAGSDEFSLLADDFNRMTRRLAAAEEAHERRTRELEDAVKDLENFSYSVSHDLRAPLRAIDGFIGILQEDYAEALDEEGRRLFGVVSSNAKKMEQLIDDILALSRAGRLELECIEVDMNALVDEVWAPLLEQEAGRPIHFVRDDLPPAVCDPRAVRQVWQNLLLNALKFTRGRQPAVIAVSAVQESDAIRYSVSDNGAGFDPAYTHKLFGLFLRLHGMDEFEGTGVGLAIVKRFVERHQGRVAATGAVDAGASFSFTLPAGPNEQSEERAHGDQRIGGRHPAGGRQPQ